MTELFWILVSVAAFHAIVFIPLSAAAHYEVFRCWPKTWQEWVFVWIEPHPWDEEQK